MRKVCGEDPEGTVGCGVGSEFWGEKPQNSGRVIWVIWVGSTGLRRPRGLG